MNIVVCTEYGDNYAEIAAITTPVMLEYCERHGYTFIEIKLKDGNNYAYKKNEVFMDIMKEGVDVIFYLDVDCIISNLTIPVTDFIDKENDLFITMDWNEINGGSLILKNTEEGRWVNSAILSVRDKFENEQNAINWLIGDPNFNQFVKILPQRTINAYKYELYPEIGKLAPEQGQWEEGCFVLHTPGASFQTRLEALKSTPIVR